MLRFQELLLSGKKIREKIVKICDKMVKICDKMLKICDKIVKMFKERGPQRSETETLRVLSNMRIFQLSRVLLLVYTYFIPVESTSSLILLYVRKIMRCSVEPRILVVSVLCSGTI